MSWVKKTSNPLHSQGKRNTYAKLLNSRTDYDQSASPSLLSPIFSASMLHVIEIGAWSCRPILKRIGPFTHSEELWRSSSLCLFSWPDLLQLNLQGIPLVQIACSVIQIAGRYIRVECKIIVGSSERFLDLLNIFKILRTLFPTVKLVARIVRRVRDFFEFCRLGSSK